MSDIVLSASVRQNLLSLQSTADLLATTQERLATGKKVNTALDNPTNFFTAQALDNRASDISNLLDGIGNGVQVLQAANTGITSLQKLIDTREVDRQPGAADHGRLFHQVQRLDHDPRCDAGRPARHHHLCQRDRQQQRALYTAPPAARRAASRALRRLALTSGALTGSAATAGDGSTALAGTHHADRHQRHDARPVWSATPSRPTATRSPSTARPSPSDGRRSGRDRLFRPVQASAATSSPTATATRPSISATPTTPTGDRQRPADRDRSRQRREDARRSAPVLRRSPERRHRRYARPSRPSPPARSR